jgi:hypothetical protein
VVGLGLLAFSSLWLRTTFIFFFMVALLTPLNINKVQLLEKKKEG